PYERYDEMVVRQTAIHLSDELWVSYSFQTILDWVLLSVSTNNTLHVADIGCGVGRIIGELASLSPQGKFWGIDTSYQMLRRAKEYWIDGKTIPVDWSHRGLKVIHITGHTLSNLNFALAKAEQLFFDNNSLDVILSSFLIDRLVDPIKGLKEMFRILKPDGKLLLVSPLNFQQSKNWELLYPIEKLIQQVENLGFKIENFNSEILIEEPLDARANKIHWNCVAIVATK
ncbi:MAG TPA: methyltransferase domain-containing protein, partial [Bacteroidetes bacterium]|nr:methyltransferase domain-containing protein [Bacteroidota bacterium]